MKITIEEFKKLELSKEVLDRFIKCLGDREETTIEEIALKHPIQLEVFWFLAKIKYTGSVEFPDGDKYWYKKGKLHRDDGPAVEYSDGCKQWWINGHCKKIDYLENCKEQSL